MKGRISSHLQRILDKAAESDRLSAELTQARAAMDGADCTHREGGDTRHCGLENPCWHCRADALEAECTLYAASLKRADARVEELEGACVKASAELRHATRGRRRELGTIDSFRGYDSNLIDKAVVVLERALSPAPKADK